MPKVNAITDSILAIENEIINNIAFKSVDVYQFLHNEFNKGYVIKNNLFHFVYRSFYRKDHPVLMDIPEYIIVSRDLYFDIYEVDWERMVTSSLYFYYS